MAIIDTHIDLREERKAEEVAIKLINEPKAYEKQGLELVRDPVPSDGVSTRFYHFRDSSVVMDYSPDLGKLRLLIASPSNGLARKRETELKKLICNET